LLSLAKVITLCGFYCNKKSKILRFNYLECWQNKETPPPYVTHTNVIFTLSILFLRKLNTNSVTIYLSCTIEKLCGLKLTNITKRIISAVCDVFLKRHKTKIDYSVFHGFGKAKSQFAFKLEPISILSQLPQKRNLYTSKLTQK
jgi:hypothetical protein